MSGPRRKAPAHSWSQDSVALERIARELTEMARRQRCYALPANLALSLSEGVAAAAVWADSMAKMTDMVASTVWGGVTQGKGTT